MYTPQTFEDGEVLSAAELNKMEAGISTNALDIAKLLDNNAAAPDGSYNLVIVKQDGKLVPVWAPSGQSDYIYDATAGAVSPNSAYRRTKLYDQANLQDGAIYDGKSFVGDANGTIYIKTAATGEAIQAMALDKNDVLTVHSNAVAISTRTGVHLYSNVYSNYKSAEDKHIGECCVYSLSEASGVWSNALAQIIKIGFLADETYWPPETEPRPYGNFVVDDENNILYAYVLYSGKKKIYWYKFNLPEVTAGAQSSVYGCPVCTLTTADILDSWQTEYLEYIQGGCVHDGLIWSTSGADGYWGRAKMSVIDPEKKTTIATFNFWDDDNAVEPEYVAFDGDVLYYGDIKTMYKLTLM